MRKIVAGLFSTLDGVIEAPEKWNPPYYDDELNRAVMPLLADAGTHLYGRRSYELFRVVFTGPAAPPRAGLMTAAEKAVLTARGLSGVRLSCQVACAHDMTVRAISRLAGSGRPDAGKRPTDDIQPRPVEWVPK